MRVKHLIRELLKCDPEAEVSTEGCDCIGDSYSVQICRDGVMITRSDEIELGTEHMPDRKYAEYENGADTPDPLDEPESFARAKSLREFVDKNFGGKS